MTPTTRHTQTRSDTLRHTGSPPQWVGTRRTPGRDYGAQNGIQSALYAHGRAGRRTLLSRTPQPDICGRIGHWLHTPTGRR